MGRVDDVTVSALAQHHGKAAGRTKRAWRLVLW